MADGIIYERSTIENGEGQVFQVSHREDGLVRFVGLETDETGTCCEDVCFQSRDAVAAARAILKHFGEEE